jgi:hypothetical protein
MHGKLAAMKGKSVCGPPGQAPVEKDPRVEIVRYITPFSDYNRGELATYVFADADVSAYAGTLADAGKDVWIGIASGANPYDGDPCTDAQVTPEFRQVGYKFSVEIVSSGTLNPGSNTVTLSVSPGKIPSGSFYATTINFTSP